MQSFGCLRDYFMDMFIPFQVVLDLSGEVIRRNTCIHWKPIITYAMITESVKTSTMDWDYLASTLSFDVIGGNIRLMASVRFRLYRFGWDFDNLLQAVVFYRSNLPEIRFIGVQSPNGSAIRGIGGDGPFDRVVVSFDGAWEKEACSRLLFGLYLGGAREGATSELVTEYMERKGISPTVIRIFKSKRKVLTETHLDSSIGDAEIFPDNYTVFMRDRNKNGRHGGGVLIALKSKKYVYCYKKADWLQLKLTLSQIPWNLALLKESIDENWNSWKDLFFAALDECIPKTKGKKRQNAPWINKELICLCRKKKLLYKKAKRSQNESTWIRYRQMNNNLKRKCNEARWRYITDLAQDLTNNNNPKPFWNFVKSKCKGTNKLISLKVGESVFTDDQVIADSMNSYFSSIFTVENYDNIPVLDYIVDERLEKIRCSVDEVEKLLLNRKVEKSRGPDNIPARILKMNILSENQFAYLKGKSTVTQQLLTVDWVRSRNSGVPTDVIFLDLAKAFDSVPHERLILKLRSYGIGSLLTWFRHFITGRKQRVVIRGMFSEWSTVSSGTPQVEEAYPTMVTMQHLDSNHEEDSDIDIL
ncbi:Hypothetical predicted protein [Paramuricea clavata]|uniref:Reverse transcriptase domain-containing protein n=1 Tax=Paramuricea clavata TaxID=317549 RepID=A0A7D9DQX3_PARCT|nr:Hypothetical predicted protein [Paramuricea clavata]